MGRKNISRSESCLQRYPDKKKLAGSSNAGTSSGSVPAETAQNQDGARTLSFDLNTNTPYKERILEGPGCSQDKQDPDHNLSQNSSGQTTLGAVLKDAGVRRELTSCRWLLIYTICTIYISVFAFHGIPENWRGSLEHNEGRYGIYTQMQQSIPVEPGSSSNEDHGDSKIHIEDLKDETTDSKDGNINEIPNAHEISLTNMQRDNPAHVKACEQASALAALEGIHQFDVSTEGLLPPLVFGGIGDSGTRAIAYLATQLGVWMGRYGTTVRKDSRDSRLFINGFDTLVCGGDSQLESVQQNIKSFVFYSKSIKACNSLGYDRDCVQDGEVWSQGVQWTTSLLQTLADDTKTYATLKTTKGMYPFGLWGFKHPRASFVLPYINFVTSNRFKYVHIVRDGRDIAAGDNQYFFNSICKKYHTDDSSLCDDTLVNKIELWSRLNLDVLSWGRQHLRPEQFLVVRIEDFVLGDPACFWRLANFTGTSKERAQITIAKSVRLFTVKRSRYFGLKYTASQVEEYSNALDKNPYIGRAFKALGYGIRPWRPEGPCTQIPTFGFDT